MTLVAVTTRSKLRGLRFFPAMLVATIRTRRQLSRTRGIVRWASVIGGPTEFWTLTVWSGVHELQEFMRSGAHGEVMWRMPRWLRSFWLARWRPGGRELGAWDGLRLVAAEPETVVDVPADEGAEFVLRALAAGALTYERSPLVRRSRERLAGVGGVVVRLSASPRLLPRALVELHRLRRALEDDGELIRAFVGVARFREVYLFALWRDRTGPRALLEADWTRRAQERWGDRLWALECLPENEFGHWDGVRMRALRPRRSRFRARGGGTDLRAREREERTMDIRKLLLKSLGEILAVERALADEVLPELRDQASEKHFREALEEHVAQTRGHVANVERVFEQLGETPKAEDAPGFEGLRRQHEEGAAAIGAPALLDLFSASSAAHTEHFEISAYHSLITLATLLGEPEAVRLLEQNLHEEEEALEKLEKSIPEKLSEELVAA